MSKERELQKITQGDKRMNENLISPKRKWAAALLAMFLGTMGIHRFYLGRNASGAIMLVVFLLGVFIPIIGWGLLIVEIVFVWIDFFRILCDSLKDANNLKLR